jgi:L-ascorbate metabolism protein UlaG (beta-lactamase superfamily)
MLLAPYHSDDSLLADVRRASEQALHLWWLGQSGFLVKWSGRHLLFDPYLSDSLTKKYARTARPHVRMTARVVAPERLDFLDVVTSSHNHTDHLDAETLVPILKANPGLTLVVPEANRTFAASRLAVDASRLTGLEAGTTIQVAGFSIHAVPAAHEALDVDEEGRHRFLGYVVRCGPWTIYHSGDTVRYDGLAERLVPWNVDVALLPINGRDPARGVAGNLSGPEAAALARDIGARHVVPCHVEMFAFNTASPEPFVDACRQLDQSCTVLRAGERLTLTS